MGPRFWFCAVVLRPALDLISLVEKKTTSIAASFTHTFFLFPQSTAVLPHFKLWILVVLTLVPWLK